MKEEELRVARSTTLARFLPLFLIINVGAILGAGIYLVGRQNQRDLDGIRKEVETLNTGQTALRKDLGDVRDLLRRQPASPTAAPREIVLSLADAPFKGSANAPVTLVEFTDYECSFCARHVKETFPQLARDYIETGKVKYVFRNFPLESIHKQSFKAHEASTCAADQGKFWEMHDRLFASQPALTPDQLIGYAQTLGLNAGQFQACFSADRHAAEIRKDISEGEKAGVTGTPTFFLGATTPNSPTLKVTNTLVGAKQYSSFKEAIDALLAAKPAS